MELDTEHQTTSHRNFKISMGQKTATTALTCFLCLVKDAETPGALPTTFDNLHAEFVLCVRSEVIDVDVEIGGVVEAEFPWSTRSESHRVVAFVCYALVPTKGCVGPSQDDCA